MCARGKTRERETVSERGKERGRQRERERGRETKRDRERKREIDRERERWGWELCACVYIWLCACIHKCVNGMVLSTNTIILYLIQ